MARYFFDVDDGEGLGIDREGLDFAHVEQACLEALRALPAIVQDVLPDGDVRTVSVAVRGQDGVVILRASLTLRCEWTNP